MLTLSKHFQLNRKCHQLLSECIIHSEVFFVTDSWSTCWGSHRISCISYRLHCNQAQNFTHQDLRLIFLFTWIHHDLFSTNWNIKLISWLLISRLGRRTWKFPSVKRIFEFFVTSSFLASDRKRTNGPILLSTVIYYT